MLVSAPGVDLTEQKNVVYVASEEDKIFLMVRVRMNNLSFCL